MIHGSITGNVFIVVMKSKIKIYMNNLKESLIYI